VLLGVLSLIVIAAAAVFAVTRAGAAPAPPAPSITSSPTNPTTQRSASFSYSEAYGSSISMGPQSMQGDLKGTAGDWLDVGYQFNYAGKHPASTVSFQSNQFTFAVACSDGSTPTQSTFVVSAPDASYPVGVNDNTNYPAGSTKSAATYEDAVQLPPLCGTTADNIRLQKGGTFTSLLSATDTADKVQIQWHYVDTGAGKKANSSINCSSLAQNPDPGLNDCQGGWSGTLNTAPGTAASSVSFQCQLDNGGFSPCGTGATGSITYAGPLSIGSHTFQVEAVVASTPSSPASYTWTIAKTTPTLSVTGPGSPGSGTAGTPVPGSAIWAALAGGFSPTGTITFTLFGPSASAPSSCASGGSTIGTATVSGNGSYHPSTGFTTTVAGNYWLYASYGGDGGNNAAASACPPGTAQEIVVGKASTTLSLTGPGSPGSSTVGVAIPASAISAVLASGSGANASGTIGFVYFQQASAPTSCSGGTAIGTAGVSGNAAYHPGSGFTPTVAGAYWLYATYGGDANNNAAASACPPGAAQEIVVGKASPSLALTGPGSPGSGTAGTPIGASAITATLAGGVSPSGAITFVFFQQASAPSSCASGGTVIGTATVTGNTSLHPGAGFTPTVAGNYWLYASYGGDGNNNGAPSACPPGPAQEIVVGKASPTLKVSAPATLAAGDSVTTAQLTATLAASSGTNATSTITFKVFGPQASPPTVCTNGGTTVGTATPAGNGTYASSAGLTPDTAGTYWWYVSSPADANNNAAAGTCNSSGMTKTVVAGPTGQLTISGDAVAPVYPGGTPAPIAITFSNPNNAAVDVTGLTVTVASTGATGCATGDFQVTQSNITSSNRFTVPAHGTATIPTGGPVSRPTIRMIDNGDQDACAGAHLTLTYSSS
jgi:hypothetical protein